MLIRFLNIYINLFTYLVRAYSIPKETQSIPRRLTVLLFSFPLLVPSKYTLIGLGRNK